MSFVYFHLFLEFIALPSWILIQLPLLLPPNFPNAHSRCAWDLPQAQTKANRSVLKAITSKWLSKMNKLQLKKTKNNYRLLFSLTTYWTWYSTPVPYHWWKVKSPHLFARHHLLSGVLAKLKNGGVTWEVDSKDLRKRAWKGSFLGKQIIKTIRILKLSFLVFLWFLLFSCWSPTKRPGTNKNTFLLGGSKGPVLGPLDKLHLNHLS